MNAVFVQTIALLTYYHFTLVNGVITEGDRCQQAHTWTDDTKKFLVVADRAPMYEVDMTKDILNQDGIEWIMVHAHNKQKSFNFFAFKENGELIPLKTEADVKEADRKDRSRKASAMRKCLRRAMAKGFTGKLSFQGWEWLADKPDF